jgi:outer membrane protein TolC
MEMLMTTLLVLIAGLQAAPPQRTDTVSLTLEEALSAAMSRNLELLGAWEGVRVARSQLTRAHGTFDPELQFEPGYSYSEQMHYTVDGRERASLPSRRYATTVSGMLRPGTEYHVGSTLQSSVLGQQVPGNTHELSFTLTQPLLRGFGLATAPIHAAEQGIAGVEGRYQQRRNEIVARVSEQYQQLGVRDRQLASATRSLQRAEDLERAYTELRALARVTEIDLLTARHAVAERRAAVLSAERGRRDAQDELLFAMYGTDAPRMAASEDVVYRASDTTIVVPELPPLPEAIATALVARPDIKGAQADVEQEQINERVARNALLPTLNLGGTFTAAGVGRTGWSLAPRDVEAGNKLDWGLGLTVSYPLRASQARGNHEEARALVRQTELALASARNVAQLEVRSAYRAITIERERLALQREATRLARLQYEGERERLRLGVTDLFRVLQFEDAVGNAELAELAASLDLASAVARYTAAIGQGR